MNFNGSVITVKMLGVLCTARCYWHRGEICTLTDPWLNEEVKMMPGILGLVGFFKMEKLSLISYEQCTVTIKYLHFNSTVFFLSVLG